MGTLELNYSSNVDQVYPEEENPNLQKDDFYLVPGLRFTTQPIPFFRNSTLSLSGGIGYQNYVERSDLDTELYNLQMIFNTVLPRMTLGGSVGTDYSIDNSADAYVPGGITRDPTLTQNANLVGSWSMRKLRLEAHGGYTMERHDYAEYQSGDNDEASIFAGIYLDLFTWGSLYYSWERVDTSYVQTGVEDVEITREMGLTGAIPLNILRRPKITYSLGFEYKDEEADNPEALDGTWEPKHTIRAEDSFQLSKAITLSGYVQWENEVYVNDVGFTYALLLEQLLGQRARHSLSFEQEPRPTLGSTTDTETTTYAYNFNIKDLFIYNLSMGFMASHEESTPLTGAGALTEITKKLALNLAHNRQISRQLSRIISCGYTWETSNFHEDGAKQELLITYGLNYDF